MEETVSEFVAGLHRLSEYCQFAATLDDMLRVVCGIRDRRLQKRLLAETDLTFQKALDGLHPTKEKARAISEAPALLNVTQLRSFLGVVNYCSKFLPNLSTMLAPLYRLLQKQTKWIWDAEQDKAFHEAKTHLTSECLLIHYDPQKELVLSCDTSSYGIGAVLSHRLQDGSERPVAFASRP